MRVFCLVSCLAFPQQLARQPLRSLQSLRLLADVPVLAQGPPPQAAGKKIKNFKVDAFVKQVDTNMVRAITKEEWKAAGDQQELKISDPPHGAMRGTYYGGVGLAIGEKPA